MWSCSARPGPARPTSRSPLGIRACLAGHRVAFRTATEWVALLADAQRHGRLDNELDRLQLSHTRIHAGRPQTNGNVEALHKTILDECWRPAFARYIYPRLAGLRRELNTYLRFYNHDRVHHGRLTHGRIPADIVYRARKMEAR